MREPSFRYSSSLEGDEGQVLGKNYLICLDVVTHYVPKAMEGSAYAYDGGRCVLPCMMSGRGGGVEDEKKERLLIIVVVLRRVGKKGLKLML